MRVDVKKYLFVGLSAKVKSFFEEAQERGIVEFIDQTATKVREVPQEIQRTIQGIKVLRGLPTVEQEETQDWSLCEGVVQEILSLQSRLEKLREEQRVLSQEMVRVAPYGNFQKEELEFLREEGKRHLQFFAAKTAKVEELEDFPELVYCSSQHGMDYFVSVSAEPRSYEGMMEMRIEKPLGELEARERSVCRESADIETRLEELAKYNTFLHEALTLKLDAHHLQTAQSLVDLEVDDHLFSIEGWVASDQVQTLEALVDHSQVHCEEVAIEEADRVPTSLSNAGMARIGEDLVHIYDTPGVEDKDPSPWVLWAFALFFAMIIGDGGYGLIFLALSAFLYFKYPNLEGAGKRVLTLSTLLATSCIVWGILTNSFFGISFELGSPFRDFSMVQCLAEKKAEYHLLHQDSTWEFWTQKFPAASSAQTGYAFLEQAASENSKGSLVYEALNKFSDGVMLELALIVGMIHIALSFLRNIKGSWAGVGWIAFMAGAYLNFPAMLDATSMAHYVLGLDKVAAAEAGKELLFGGMGGAILLALIQHKGSGALEIMNLIQVFSDVLSYLRLYALGLAGGMMSSTFNQIGADLPTVAGVVVIVIGHTVNIVLSIMGGVIHGLRLNFLEWYHYCFEGGGKLLNPLRRVGAEQ